MKKKNFGKIVLVAAGIMTGAFAVLHTVGKRNKKKNEAGIDDDNQYLNKTDDGKKPSAHHKTSGYERVWKPVIDKALSFAGLVVLAPIYGLISLAIVIDDPGPVLFTQKRVGKDKHFFKLHKFRSMKMSTPHDTPTHLLENPEQYITKVGKFLRKTSLDELPQIWDIFVGNMSIIGPRPALWNQDDLVEERDKWGANNVTPGLTGWAQINGRDELEIPDKAKLDGDYVAEVEKGGLKALLFDIKCFFGTISSVANEEGVVEGGTGEMKKQGYRLDTAGQDCMSIQGEDEYHTGTGEGENQKPNPDHLKILVICQYYYPEPFRISDICEELVKRGHEVTVVTGTPNYPMGEIYPSYENGQKMDEVLNGVKVHRCPIRPRKTGTVNRLLNYYSYSNESMKYVDSLPGTYDVVFINQLSPVMMAQAGIEYAKKNHKKTVMYCLDLWPESLVAGGITRTSPVYKLFNAESKCVYKAIDKIFVTSCSFSDYFQKQFGIGDTEYLPQFAEDLFNPEDCKKTPDGFIDLMFAGNVGTAQSVETIVKAAELCKDIPNLRWHIVGDGVELERLKEISAGLPITFYGRKPVEDMPKYYSTADAMLVTMKKDPVLSLTLPGKVQSYMAAGKAIIGTIDGETQKIVREADCGNIAPAEDAEKLAELVKRYCSDTVAAWQKKGMNGKKYYEENFARNIFMDKIENTLKTYGK